MNTKLSMAVIMALFSLTQAQDSVAYNLVSCTNSRSDSYCLSQNIGPNPCCAQITFQNKALAAAQQTQTGFYCIAAELGRSIGNYTVADGQYITYSCLSNSTAQAPTTCSSDSDCQSSQCCSARGVQINTGEIQPISGNVCTNETSSGISGIGYTTATSVVTAQQQVLLYARACIGGNAMFVVIKGAASLFIASLIFLNF
eukprot:403373095